MRVHTRRRAGSVLVSGIPKGGREIFHSSTSFFYNLYGRTKDQDTKNVQEVKKKPKNTEDLLYMILRLAIKLVSKTNVFGAKTDKQK